MTKTTIKKHTSKLAALLLSCGLIFGTSTTAFAYSEPEEITENAVPEETESEKNPFTPDGNASILNEATSEQNKHFYTIQTENNNTFYMVIDKERASGNVYLLSMIDENDLMEFVEETDDTASEPPAFPESELFPDKETSPEPPDSKPLPEEPDSSEPEKKSGGNTFGTIALLGLAAAIFAGYYFLKIRKKGIDEDDEDETIGDETEEIDDYAEATEAEEVEETDDTDTMSYPDYPDPNDYPDESQS